MLPSDEKTEGEAAFGESSGAEQGTTSDATETPSVRTFDEGGDFDAVGDVDGDTLRAFVVAVIYANVALLFVSLGPMLWFFEGSSRLGPGLLVIGVLAGIRTYQTYRAWDRSRESDTAEHETFDGSESDATAPGVNGPEP